jgi:DNA-binding CsgD family transcriptional regulator
MNSDPGVAAEAFQRGASGYVLKHSGAEDFITAIRKVVRGESYLSPLIARETLTYLMQLPKEQRSGKHITMRQAEILQLLAEGRSMKEIADVLEITPGTVAFHKYDMMDRLGITTNAGLLQYALQHHMISAQEDCQMSAMIADVSSRPSPGSISDWPGQPASGGPISEERICGSSSPRAGLGNSPLDV